MNKTKRWVLVLSAFCIGFLGATAFASYKITNNPKNETSFNLKADGDVSEGKSSQIKVVSVSLPQFSNKGGFVGTGITAPSQWGTSDSGIIGYPIIQTGKIILKVKLVNPKDYLQIILKGEKTKSTTTLKEKDGLNLIRKITSITPDSSDLTITQQPSFSPAVANDTDKYTQYSVVYTVPDTRKNRESTVTFTFDVDLGKDQSKWLNTYLYYNDLTITASAAYVQEEKA